MQSQILMQSQIQISLLDDLDDLTGATRDNGDPVRYTRVVSVWMSGCLRHDSRHLPNTRDERWLNNLTTLFTRGMLSGHVLISGSALRLPSV